MNVNLYNYSYKLILAKNGMLNREKITVALNHLVVCNSIITEKATGTEIILLIILMNISSHIYLNWESKVLMIFDIKNLGFKNFILVCLNFVVL